MVIGDFNARTGRAANFISSDSYADYATYDNHYSPVYTCDIRNSDKVQVGKDQEKAESENDSHSKNRGGKKQTNNQVLIP